MGLLQTEVNDVTALSQTDASFWTVGNPVVNAFYNVVGEVSPYQKAQLIQQGTTEYQQAGMDAATAQAQATADVTTTLTDANSDPSQPITETMVLGPGGPTLHQVYDYIGGVGSGLGSWLASAGKWLVVVLVLLAAIVLGVKL